MTDLASMPSEPRRITGRTVFMAFVVFFGVIFIANGFLLYFAFSTFSGIEGKSAYEAGLRYEERAAFAEAQAELGWTVAADVTFGDNGIVEIDLSARDRYGAPLRGVGFTATFERLIQDDDDVALTLTEREPGLFVGTTDQVADGQWRLVIEGSDNNGPLYRSANRVVLGGN